MIYQLIHKRHPDELRYELLAIKWCCSRCSGFVRSVTMKVTFSKLKKKAGEEAVMDYTGCSTRYLTRHFFNNSNTKEDIATKFEQEYVRCVRNEEECVCSHWNILISGKIIKEMPGSVESGTHCIWYFPVTTEDKHNRRDNISINVILRSVRVTNVVEKP